ncbi:MAG: immunity 8 family protein [Oscillatoriophycideae cyanobacterium NC_groundwater_1537_Pr4_S-0.65um_50_18]|nr:immunity 8 family protein [Oscillatoriophycideae cyanobacterium NC_groundwater_1537_Pr4_S-0.65um_50_18]
MLAELRRLHSPDLLDLEFSTPEDPENFCILVQAMIGSKDEEGEESFDFLVCTPQWIVNHIARNKALFGRHYLIISHYDFEIIWNAIDGRCKLANRSSWREVGSYLNKYGHWEFDDYVDF